MDNLREEFLLCNKDEEEEEEEKKEVRRWWKEMIEKDKTYNWCSWARKLIVSCNQNTR